jgi:hypothetical protein
MSLTAIRPSSRSGSATAPVLVCSCASVVSSYADCEPSTAAGVPLAISRFATSTGVGAAAESKLVRYPFR